MDYSETIQARLARFLVSVVISLVGIQERFRLDVEAIGHLRDNGSGSIVSFPNFAGRCGIQDVQ
jgi:hypothetical protein